MSSPDFVAATPEFLAELKQIAGGENVITDDASIDVLSKDFYWYSPVLKARLESHRAAVAVKVTKLEVLKAVVSCATRARIPTTLRGAATGNYGQCIPLFGGLVIDLSGMDRILSIEDGVVTAEPGARLISIEQAARPKGWELRCYPSTWVKASVGGFLGGGSGGIGSISWGGLGESGTIKRITLLTMEESPRLITLNEAEVMPAFHAYGTNGIMVEVQLRLAPAYPWDQLVVAGKDWARLVDFADEIARDDGIRKRLVTVLENPIPSYFKPIKKFYPADHHVMFLECESSATPAVKTRAEAAGLTVAHTIPHHEPRRAPMLSDYTWNHTTLWAIKADEATTYLQMGCRDNFREQLARVKQAYGDEVLLHLEFTRNRGSDGVSRVGVGGIPLVRFTTEDRLREIIRFFEDVGIGIADPHTCFVEEGWRGANWTKHHQLKSEADPHALMNPGKFKHYAADPLTRSSALPSFLFP